MLRCSWNIRQRQVGIGLVDFVDKLESVLPRTRRNGSISASSLPVNGNSAVALEVCEEISDSAYVTFSVIDFARGIRIDAGQWLQPVTDAKLCCL